MPPRGEIEQLFGVRFDFLEQDEQALARFRPSVRLMVAEVAQQVLIILLQVGIALAVLVYARQTGDDGLRQAALYALAPFLGFGLFFVVQRLVRTGLEIYYTEYVITDRRTYSVTAVVSRKLKAVPFEKVTNLGVRRSFFERLIRVDEIHLSAYGAKGTSIQMRGVEKTDEVLRRLQTLTRAGCSAETLFQSD